MSKATLFSILSLFLFAISSSAQVKQLKFYGSANVLKTTIRASPVWMETDRIFQHKHFSIGYLFSKKDTRIHQIELHRLVFKKDDPNGLNRRSIEVNFQYSMANLLWQSESKKIQFYYGPMARLLGGYVWTQPQTSTTFPSRTKMMAFTLGGLAELNWRLSEKTFLIARLPIELMSFSINQTEVDNPVLSEQQQRSGGFDYELLINNLFPSIGVGFDL